jgi:hypothetical protein
MINAIAEYLDSLTDAEALAEAQALIDQLTGE